MLTSLIIAALLVLSVFPQAAMRLLRRLLVEAPARRLNGLRPGHWALVVGVAILIALAVAMGREGVVVAAQAPEFVAWFAAFDIATYAEVIAAAVLVAAAVRLKGTVQVIRAALGGRRQVQRPRARRPQVRQSRRRKPPPDSEGEPWPAALALA